ncbi:MAG: DUF6285 domain-containing protein [Dongiaceae bacterium]
MSADQPDGGMLLAAARRLLLEELLPLLPPERRYEGLMIGNAMAIAGRELADGGAAGRAAASRLAAFCGDTAAPAEALERRLAAGIRAGRYDRGAARGALLALLREDLRDRLRLANPKALG